METKNNKHNTITQEQHKYRNIYPNIRYLIAAKRNSYLAFKTVTSSFARRHNTSSIIPNNYTVHNTTTVDGEFKLQLLFGEIPEDLDGNLYICQCLGSPTAYMVGDANIIKVSFTKNGIFVKNRFLWNASSIAKAALQNSSHRFDHCGLMYMSPGVGITSYVEGIYILPDGRLGVTSDIDRPCIIDRDSLRAQSTLGSRKDWMPMMCGQAGDVMGSLFAGYNNSHALYTDTHTNEAFLVNYQLKQEDGSHPCKLMRWNGSKNLMSWSVVNENGADIRIRQSVHELVFTKDYIILADTAFITGDEIIRLWKNAPIPSTKTTVYIIDRRQLTQHTSHVVAKNVTIEEACIHLIAEYENPHDIITLYMLHTPATNTAEIIRNYDIDLHGKRFPKHLIGYGTLPVLDLSSLGKHQINMNFGTVASSEYIRDATFCFGPYMYTYLGRQTRPFQEQDLFIMCKGFHANLLPKRIYNAYKDVVNRKVPLSDMVNTEKTACNSSIARIQKSPFKVTDIYFMPNQVYLHTISCLESSTCQGKGYVLAGVTHETANNTNSSGHEYWLFDADNLRKGPICKLGHQELHNSILFHTVHLTCAQEKALDKKKTVYNLSLREDYPADELSKWSPCVQNTFEQLIWPYFDHNNPSQQEKAQKALQQLKNMSNKTHQM